jgi:tyrosinase
MECFRLVSRSAISGKKAMPAQLSLRKNVDNLSATDLKILRQGYTKLQDLLDNRGYNFLAGLHGVPSWYCHAPGFLFLPWHRAYLYTFEQYLKDMAPSATVPWWDWSSDTSHTFGMPKAFSDLSDDSGQRNPLLNSRINAPLADPPTVRFTERSTGQPSLLPTPERVQDLILRSTDFMDLTGRLDDTHNQIHQWVGSDMATRAYAAYDPIFFSHHAMVDRIWYLWQIQHGLNTIPVELLDAVLPPFNLKVADVLDITRLGYDYSAAQITS